MDCSRQSALIDVLKFPLFWWIYMLANYGHALEAWLGIPPWISYFSGPDMPVNQLIEALFFVPIFGGFGLLCPIADMLRTRAWRWCDVSLNLRLMGGFFAIAWANALFYRALINGIPHGICRVELVNQG